MTLKSVQNCVREEKLFYPPDATERSAFIGGNVATNASGARSFKYGATREWVQALRVVLPSGEEITLDRDGDEHQLNGTDILIRAPTGDYRIPRPQYLLPETRKNVAGPVITDQSQPIDLFIGTGGLFGIVSEVTLRLIPEPPQHVSIFAFVGEVHQALELVERCRSQRDQSHEPIPMSVEYLGPHATSIMREEDNSIPESTNSVVILEQDAHTEDELYGYLEYWVNLFEELGIQDSSVAQEYQEIEHHKFLRHKVPETVNATVKGNGQSKLGTDYSVPPEHFRALFDYVFDLGERFERYQRELGPRPQHFGFAFWAHAGDAHVHLNLLPRTDTEMAYAKSIFVELMHQIIAWKGSIAAEHGLGKKYFDGKPALEFQYGTDGITQIQKMKQVMDPLYLLNPDNLVGRIN
jgi:D-lactate dehydrogenase (cytochrome)